MSPARLTTPNPTMVRQGVQTAGARPCASRSLPEGGTRPRLGVPPRSGSYERHTRRWPLRRRVLRSLVSSVRSPRNNSPQAVPPPTSSDTTQLGGCSGSPEVPRAPGCLRRSGHKRLEGEWSSPVVVPIERKDPGGHPTGRRDLDEDRVWCQRRDRARGLSNDRGFSEVLHLAPNALDCGEQRGPGCRCPDGRRTGHALFSRLRRRFGFGHSGHAIAGQPGSCSADRMPPTDWTRP